MLDAKDILKLNISFTFIESYPNQLNNLLTDNEKEVSNIIISKVQDISLDVFKELKAGDTLFIDGSYV